MSFELFAVLGTFFVATFAALLAVLQSPRETRARAPVPPPVPTIPPTVPESEPERPDMLDIFCTAMRDFEGKPGDLNYFNNNPGNCRCSSEGYLPKYGNVRCISGFAVFPSYEQGWEYLKAIVRGRVVKHPTWTLLDFFSNYAPAADHNQPATYAAFVAKRCGVSTASTLVEVLG